MLFWLEPPVYPKLSFSHISTKENLSLLVLHPQVTCYQTAIYFLCMGVSCFLCYLVKIVGIFMRGNDVQMEVLPADVNLDGHRSALICFSSWNMAFAQCLSLSLLPFFSLSSFLPHCCLSFRYSNKWKWRLWWLECLQPSFSLSQCIWRALQQHGTAASCRALQ